MTHDGLGGIIESGGTVHLMGIGGAGMAGLGLVLKVRGVTVTGCDQKEATSLRDLAGRGISVQVGHDPDHATTCDALIHSAAVDPDHPELKAARRRGIPVIKRSRALAEVVNPGRLVAVAGTHGKTTTTALTAFALAGAGLDPTALVGGRVSDWGGNARTGAGETFVVEADEYDRAFLDLSPEVAVVTSMEAEHVDTYPDVAELEAAFRAFVDRVSGALVACVDDLGAAHLLEGARSERLGYGLGDAARLRAESVVYGPESTRFEALYDDASLGPFELRLHGAHNVRNALAAIGVALTLDVELDGVRSALARFSGVERRFQLLGASGGITVIDDYAHHPTEIAATLQAARQVFADRRLVVAFQPHLYSRTRAFTDAFGRALSEADLLFVTGIFGARERPVPGLTGQVVAEAASAHTSEVRYVETLDELIDALETRVRPGDVVLTLGAGDIGDAARRFLDALGRSHVDA